MEMSATKIQHPKEVILRLDADLSQKLRELEAKLMQIRNELLGSSPPEEKCEKSSETPTPPGFLSDIRDRLHHRCRKVDNMNGIANEIVNSLVVEPKTPVVGS